MSKKVLKTRLYNFRSKSGATHSVGLFMERHDTHVSISVKEFNESGATLNLYGFKYTDLTQPGWRKRVFSTLRQRLYRWELFLDGKALQEISEIIPRVK